MIAKWITLAFCLPAVTLLAAEPLSVPITVTETQGVGRADEPVTCGVPLPKGLMEDVSQLVLLGPDKEPTPAAFTPAVLWHPGKSVKWVHVDFLATAPAKGSATYTLTTGKPAAVASPIKAESKDGVVTVDTGRVRFTVKSKGFNLFDSVSAGGKEIIAPHNGGGIELLSSHMGLPKNKVYSAANFDATKVEIEELNPIKAVVKVSGQHISTDDLPGPKRLLDYELRIYAFRRSPVVKVVYTFMNRQEDQQHIPLALDGLVVDLPVVAAAAGAWGLAKDDGPTLSGKTSHAVIQSVDSSNHYAIRFAGKLAHEGKTKETMTSSLGWIRVEGNDGTVWAGIRRFWQLWPKAVEATPDGHVRLHLWPNVDGKVLALPKSQPDTPKWDVYSSNGQFPTERALRSRLMPGRAHIWPGMSKTHEMVFAFYGPLDTGRQVGSEPEAMLRGNWMSIERPLRAVCPASWYCEKTQAFGKLASSDAALYPPAVAEEVKKYDERVRDWHDWLITFRAKEYGKDRGVYDQYGMFDFGDSINFENAKGKDGHPENATPHSIQWDNCYYDVPHAMMLQFLRTGDQRFLEYAVEADAHYMDVDMVCHHADPRFIGASRYCPGHMHICEEGTAIYVSNTYNHFKNLCHFDQWYLFGDHHARDRGYMAAGFVVAHGKGAISQARSVGHGIRAALEAYRAGGDEKYLKAAQGLVNYNFTRTGSGAWQDGIALEGFRELYEQTGDEKLPATIRAGVDAAAAKKDYAPAILHAFGFAYAQTGDAKYRDPVLKALPKTGTARKMWGSTMEFGNTLRNAPYVFWYLSEKLTPLKPTAPQPVGD